uniref:NADH-ubiquinone oxidoreductase chain 2 n=1 Tax=Bryozoa sp. TaxID=2813608 RepID=A0AAU8L1A1_9BILA
MCLTKVLSKYFSSWFSWSVLFMSIAGFFLASSWITVWMFLELAMMSVFPWLNTGILTYFIVQSVSSILFIYAILTNEKYFIIFSLVIKLGLFPFSFWVPLVINKSSWLGGLMLSSFLKIAPLTIFFSLDMKNSEMLTIMSVLWASFYGCYQTKVKMVLAYSSIIHTSWLFMLFVSKPENFLFYIFFYFFFTIMMFSLSFGSFSNYWSNMNHNKFPLMVVILTISGMPPFSGFWFKLLLIKTFSLNWGIFALLGLLASSASMFFYLKLISSLILQLEKNFSYLMAMIALFMTPLFYI